MWLYRRIPVSYTHLKCPLHSQRVTVWCAVGSFGITGLYILDENGVKMCIRDSSSTLNITISKTSQQQNEKLLGQIHSATLSLKN